MYARFAYDIMVKIAIEKVTNEKTGGTLMGHLIDLCGTPIEMEKVKDFRLVKREFLFCPAYKEVENQAISIFARKGDTKKKKFVFTKMVPFGALLGDKEKPYTSTYEFKNFGEAAGAEVLADVKKVLSNAAALTADFLRLDTSGLKEFNVLTEGRRVTKVKLRNIPAKVAFLSGKVSDVYKNDPVYASLGEPIVPIVVTVPTLVVNVEKHTYVFFGGGVDVEDAEEKYRFLLEEKNKLISEKMKEKHQTALPKININIPKISIPSIRIQSPFVLKKDIEEKEEMEDR